MASRRTIVVKFVLENFKSYAGVREIGPMHKRFLAVVGPNGSGKSNLIDALLFIFGKRAKKLRMKNLSSLIHNSAEHPNAREAKVEIHFCEVDDMDPVTMSEDTDDYNVLPGSEFVLARTVRQDNTTFYTLNGKRQTFDEVEQFMKLRGIDINNNRFLILQGEVEAISLMKPKGETKHEEGMLEFLEELIGTDRYVEDIEQKQLLVETLGQNRAVCLEQVKVGEKEMASLEGPKDDAMRLRALEISILDKQFRILNTRTMQSQHTCDEAAEHLRVLTGQFGEKTQQLAEQKTSMQRLQGEYDSTQAKHSQLTKDQSDAKQEWEKFERKDIKERTKAKQFETKVEKLKQSLDQARKAKFAEEEKQFELESQIPPLASAVERAEAALTAAEAELEQMFVDNREESKQVREQVERKQQELAPHASKLSQAESEVNLLERELELLRHPVTEAKAKLVQAKQEMQEAEETTRNAPELLENAERECEATAQTLQQTKQECAVQKQRESELELEVDTLQVALKQNSAQDSQVQQRGSVLQRLLAAKKRGGELDGCKLFGRLGDLGQVSADLDCAATTAAGANLDSFVTQSTEDAERCVAFLRKENLGVCTFIILDKMQQHQQMDQEFPAPRLIDSVESTDAKFLPAFYYALRDTLVARDLEHAMQVAYDRDNVCRYRVVTMKGELIDNSGTMSGGGKPRKGGFSSQPLPTGEELSANQLQDMQARLALLQQELTACREQISALIQKAAALEKQMVTQNDHVDCMRRNAETATQKLALLKARLAELSSLTQLSFEQSSVEADLLRKLEQSIPQRDACRRNADKYTQELEELNTALRKVGGERAAQCHKQVEQCRDRLDKARAALTKSQVQFDSSKASLIKYERTAEQSGADLEVALAEQANHDLERGRTEEKAMEIAQRIQVANEAVQTMLADLERTKREYYGCKDRLNALENANVDMKLQLQTAEEEVKKCEQRKTKWETDLEQSRTRLEEWKKEIEDLVQQDDDSGERQQQPSEEELTDDDLHRLENDVLRAEAEAKSLRGNVNMGAIAEYKLREREYLTRVRELDEASAARDQARAQCDELKKARLVEFMAGFSIISLKLKEIYQLITLGGDAELELVDSLDPFSEGVVFSVRPPKKSWKNISNLSGGEKTLSSLSLVFALHAFRGAPIYVMDEIDAALDFKNVSIVANYIKERTKNAQFLIISLRNNMFELADRLVGVYKTHNATKSVTIDPKKVAQKSGIAAAEAAAGAQEESTPVRTGRRSILSERSVNVD